jgi:hypothetical protein
VAQVGNISGSTRSVAGLSLRCRLDMTHCLHLGGTPKINQCVIPRARGRIGAVIDGGTSSRRCRYSVDDQPALWWRPRQ